MMKRLRDLIRAVAMLLLPATVTAASAGYDPQTVQAITVTRQGLVDSVAYLDARRDLFPVAGKQAARFPRRDARLALWQDWQGFLDRILALDRLSGEAFVAYRAADGAARPAAFRVAYAAFLAQYPLGGLGILCFLQIFMVQQRLQWIVPITL